MKVIAIVMTVLFKRVERLPITAICYFLLPPHNVEKQFLWFTKRVTDGNANGNIRSNSGKW
eukprot:13576663-Ditylum_brightwellii.AAC.1